MSRRVAILGGTGHLGRSLMRHAPDGTDLSPAHHAHPSGTSFAFDAARPGRLDAGLVIGSFPLARSLQDSDPATREAVVGRYLDAVGEARLVQLSSDAVFSGKSDTAYAEDAPPDSAEAYGRSQIEVERLILARRPDALIVRTSFIFGFSDGRADKRLAPFLAGEKRPEDQNWPANVMRSPTEVGFLARAIWALVAREMQGIVHVAGPAMSIAEFFHRALGELLPMQPPRHFLETRDTIARNTALVSTRVADIEDCNFGGMWECYRKSIVRRP